MNIYKELESKSLEEVVLDLRACIERLLPEWKVWARLDIADFQFFGWKGSIRHCAQSACYDFRRIPDASEIAQDMRVTLEHMDELEKQS